jgi:hypothetical protein
MPRLGKDHAPLPPATVRAGIIVILDISPLQWANSSLAACLLVSPATDKVTNRVDDKRRPRKV